MSARTLLLQALAQSDVDMNFFRLLNLDTSNLSISGLPPDVTPPAHNFLNGWIRGTQTWSYAQPGFADISGSLTTLQQRDIQRTGTLIEGHWEASPIANTYLPALDGISPPAASLNLNNKTISNLANPANPLDAVNLQTLNAVAPGINVHAPVAAASTGDLFLVGLNPVDGYTPAVGDRILAKDQTVTRHWQNGVWIAAVGAWTRATDFDASAEFASAYVLVLNGVQNQGNAYVQITGQPVNLANPDNGTEPDFVVFSHVSSISAGPGLTKSGNIISALGTTGRIAISKGIDIDAAYIGQSSITTLGTITTGTWEGSVLGPSFGGTGISNIGKTITLATSVVVDLSLDTPIANALAFHLNAIPTSLNLPSSGTLATLAGNETFTNKHINASQIDSGVLGLARGGTGGATQDAAAHNILPPVIGQGGKSLKTDGFNIFWG